SLPRTGVALAEDTPTGAVLRVAIPDDDEVAGRIGGDGDPSLGTRRVGVHAELVPLSLARAVVALAEDPGEAAILGFARPNHNEVTAGICCDRTIADRSLSKCRVRVDLELRPYGLSAGGSGQAGQRQGSQKAEPQSACWHGEPRDIRRGRSRKQRR